MTEPTDPAPPVQTQPEGPLMAALGGMGAAIGIIIGVTALVVTACGCWWLVRTAIGWL